MDIGLSLQPLAACHLAPGPVTVPGPVSPEPIPGILDAANVVILGASIMEGAFAKEPATNPDLAAFAAAIGFTGTLRSYAQSGHVISQTILQHQQAKADLAATEGRNLYVAHTGGNNVSGSRPYPGNAGTFEADYDTLIANVTATDTFIPLPLTKRLYGIDAAGYPNNPGDVIQGNAASEAFGSRPYNDNIIIPRIAQIAPDWLDAEGRPCVDPYAVVDRDPAILLSDGIHGPGFPLATYILSRLAARALGTSEGASRSGRSYVFAPRVMDPKKTRPNAVANIVGGYGNADPARNFIYGARDTAGVFDGFLVTRTGPCQNGNPAMTATAYARLSDPRFHTLQIVGGGIYVQGTQAYPVSFENLTPGDTVRVTCCGLRDATATNRRGNVALTGGQVLTLDAANNVPSNQIVFDPVVVPADGKISLTLTVTPGATYGYLSGVILDIL